MKNLVLMASAAILIFSACEKISNPADDAKAAGETLGKFTEDQVALDGFNNLIQDVLKNEGRLNKNGAYEVFPQEGVIRFSDSLFTDGDGIDFEIDLGLIKNSETPSQSDLKKGNDGKFYGGRYLVSMNKPFSENGCEVTVTPDYSINSDSTEVQYTKLMFIDGKYMSVALHAKNKDLITSQGVKLKLPEPIFTLRRLGAEKLELEYNLALVHLEDMNMKSQYITIGKIVAERTDGEDTPDDNTDDVYAFSGTSQAYDVVGDVKIYTVTIDANNPCIQKLDCNSNALYVQGILTMEPESGKSYRFDFGNGDCDSKVKVKVGNLPEVEISL